MADKGFDIRYELMLVGTKLNIPPFVRKHTQMSVKDVVQIASLILQCFTMMTLSTSSKTGHARITYGKIYYHSLRVCHGNLLATYPQQQNIQFLLQVIMSNKSWRHLCTATRGAILNNAHLCPHRK